MRRGTCRGGPACRGLRRSFGPRKGGSLAADRSRAALEPDPPPEASGGQEGGSL